MQKVTDFGAANMARFPLPITIAIAKTKEGFYNPITLGWWMSTSHVPPMLAISIGIRRHSLEVIRSAGEFVLSFPSEEMNDDAMYFGSHSGRQGDKIAACGTPVQPATEIDCVLLADACANFECVVDSEITTGDHVIFSGRVVASHLHENGTGHRLFILDRTKEEGFRFGGVREV